MNISVELQLLLLAIALFVQDSTLLLFANEGLLMGSWPKRKKCAVRFNTLFGSDNARFKGKELLLLSLLVHRPAFRLAWSYSDNWIKKPSATFDFHAKCVALKPLMPLMYVLALIQFVLLPIVVRFYLTDAHLIAVIALLYGTIIMTLSLLTLQRKPLKLSAKHLTTLWFECLICPPISINLVRKVSLKYVLNADLLQLSQQLLSRNDWLATQPIFLKRLDEAIDESPIGSKQHTQRLSYREQLCKNISI